MSMRDVEYIGYGVDTQDLQSNLPDDLKDLIFEIEDELSEFNYDLELKSGTFTINIEHSQNNPNFRTLIYVPPIMPVALEDQKVAISSKKEMDEGLTNFIVALIENQLTKSEKDELVKAINKSLNFSYDKDWTDYI